MKFVKSVLMSSTDKLPGYIREDCDPLQNSHCDIDLQQVLEDSPTNIFSLDSIQIAESAKF